MIADRSDPRKSATARCARSAQLKRHTGYFRNLELLARSERDVQGEAIRLGDDLAAEAIAVVELGERGTRVARSNRVHDRQDLAHVVLHRLERRPIRGIETERDEKTLLGLAEQAPAYERASLLDQRGGLLRDPTLQAFLGVLGLAVPRVDRQRDQALLESLPQPALLLQLLRALVVRRRQGVPRPWTERRGRRGDGPGDRAGGTRNPSVGASRRADSLVLEVGEVRGEVLQRHLRVDLAPADPERVRPRRVRLPADREGCDVAVLDHVRQELVVRVSVGVGEDVARAPELLAKLLDGIGQLGLDALRVRLLRLALLTSEARMGLRVRLHVEALGDHRTELLPRHAATADEVRVHEERRGEPEVL